MAKTYRSGDSNKTTIYFYASGATCSLLLIIAIILLVFAFNNQGTVHGDRLEKGDRQDDELVLKVWFLILSVALTIFKSDSRRPPLFPFLHLHHRNPFCLSLPLWLLQLFLLFCVSFNFEFLIVKSFPPLQPGISHPQYRPWRKPVSLDVILCSAVMFLEKLKM